MILSIAVEYKLGETHISTEKTLCINSYILAGKQNQISHVVSLQRGIIS